MRISVLRWVVGVPLLLIAIGAVGAWQIEARRGMRIWNSDIARRRDDPIPVRTATITEESASELIGGTAVTMPSQTASVVVTPGNGQIGSRVVMRVDCFRGAAVRQGQVLVEFESKLFERTVQQREAALSRTEAELATYRKLRRESAASALELATAECAVETARLELAMAKADFEQCVVTSPIDGVVDEVAVVPGMRVTGALTIATIHTLEPIHVQMDFPVERLDTLKVGQATEIVLDSFPQEKFSGKIIRIAPVVTQRLRVLPVIIELANPDGRLKAGITAFVRVTSSAVKTTTVPRVAIIKGDRKAMVFCINDENRAEIREIETGTMVAEGQVEVRRGLKAGDQVVVFGQDRLKNNDLVNADWHRWTRRTH